MQLQKQALEAAKQALIGHSDECTEVNDALALIDQALADQPTTTENNGGKTGWPPGLLQDDCKGLSKWLSNRPDAKRRVREALAEQTTQVAVPDLIGPNEGDDPQYIQGWNDCRALMLSWRNK